MFLLFDEYTQLFKQPNDTRMIQVSVVTLNRPLCFCHFQTLPVFPWGFGNK